MFWKHPLGLAMAPSKDGLVIIKHQGRVRFIEIAFKNETGKNIKSLLKYHYGNEKSEPSFIHQMKELTSIKCIPMSNYQEALNEKLRLIEKHKKSLWKNHSTE